MEAILSGHGPDQMAEQDICVAIGEDLTRAYPGYIWCVGCCAGSINIDLDIVKPFGLERYGFRLNVSTVLGAGGQKAVMRAGGELLERFGLRRGTAHVDTQDIAREHGLIIDGHRNKSRAS